MASGTQFRAQFLFQPADDALAYLGNIIIRKGLLSRLVGEGISQALFTRSNLLTAVDIEQGQAGNYSASNLPDKLGNFISRDGLIDDNGEVFQDGRVGRDGLCVVAVGDEADQKVEVEFRCQNGMGGKS
jgi:hypothetical protein